MKCSYLLGITLFHAALPHSDSVMKHAGATRNRNSEPVCSMKKCVITLSGSGFCIWSWVDATKPHNWLQWPSSVNGLVCHSVTSWLVHHVCLMCARKVTVTVSLTTSLCRCQNNSSFLFQFLFCYYCDSTSHNPLLGLHTFSSTDICFILLLFFTLATRSGRDSPPLFVKSSQ